MSSVLKGSRFLILLPILGLTLASALVFVLGGIGLIRLTFHVLLEALGLTHSETPFDSALVIVEVVEYVHTLLIGTVLYITAVGLYQLFIEEIDFVGWLRIESTEELETNLVGVTVVVLAVNFMGAVYARGTDNLLQYGAGIALPIAALGVFIGLRAWAGRLSRPDAARPSSQSRPARVDPSDRDPPA